MAHLLETSIKQEQQRIVRMSQTASKIERATRFQHETLLQDQQRRQKRIRQREETAQAKLAQHQKALRKQVKKMAKKRDRRLETSAAARERMVQSTLERAEELRKIRVQKMNAITSKLSERKEALLKSKRKAKSLAAARAEKDAERIAAMREQQEAKIEQKEVALRKIRDKQEQERQLRIFKAHLQFNRRRKQADRLQLAHQRKTKALEDELRIKNKRAFALKEIKSAIVVERHDVMREAKISLDHWKEANYVDPRSLEPGPGDYNLPDVFSPYNTKPEIAPGGWAAQGPKPLTDFDKRVAYAATIPAPGDYGEISDRNNSSFWREGGEWGDYAKPKSQFQMAMDRANDTPAAQDYNPTPLKSNVGSVSMHGEKPLDTPLDITIRRNKDLPSPAAYSPPSSPKAMRTLAQLRKQLAVSTNVLGFIGMLKAKRKRTKKEEDEKKKEKKMTRPAYTTL